MSMLKTETALFFYPFPQKIFDFGYALRDYNEIQFN